MGDVSQAPMAAPPAWEETGANGIHPLFEKSAIRRALNRVSAGLLRQASIFAAHAALRSLDDIHTLGHKRDFIACLPQDTLDVLIFLYFRKIDAWMGRHPVTLH